MSAPTCETCGLCLLLGEHTYECRICLSDVCPRCIDAEGRFCRGCITWEPFVSAYQVDNIDEQIK